MALKVCTSLIPQYGYKLKLCQEQSTAHLESWPAIRRPIESEGSCTLEAKKSFKLPKEKNSE